AILDDVEPYRTASGYILQYWTKSKKLACEGSVTHFVPRKSHERSKPSPILELQVRTFKTRTMEGFRVNVTSFLLILALVTNLSKCYVTIQTDSSGKVDVEFQNLEDSAGPKYGSGSVSSGCSGGSCYSSSSSSDSGSSSSSSSGSTHSGSVQNYSTVSEDGTTQVNISVESEWDNATQATPTSTSGSAATTKMTSATTTTESVPTTATTKASTHPTTDSTSASSTRVTTISTSTTSTDTDTSTTTDEVTTVKKGTNGFSTTSTPTQIFNTTEPSKQNGTVPDLSPELKATQTGGRMVVKAELIRARPPPGEAYFYFGTDFGGGDYGSDSKYKPPDGEWRPQPQGRPPPLVKPRHTLGAPAVKGDQSDVQQVSSGCVRSNNTLIFRLTSVDFLGKLQRLPTAGQTRASTPRQFGFAVQLLSSGFALTTFGRLLFLFLRTKAPRSQSPIAPQFCVDDSDSSAIYGYCAPEKVRTDNPVVPNLPSKIDFLRFQEAISLSDSVGSVDDSVMAAGISSRRKRSRGRRRRVGNEWKLILRAGAHFRLTINRTITFGEIRKRKLIHKIVALFTKRSCSSPAFKWPAHRPGCAVNKPPAVFEGSSLSMNALSKFSTHSQVFTNTAFISSHRKENEFHGPLGQLALPASIHVYVVSSRTPQRIPCSFGGKLTLEMDTLGGRRRGATNHTAEDQALDQIAKECVIMVVVTPPKCSKCNQIVSNIYVSMYGSIVCYLRTTGLISAVQYLYLPISQRYISPVVSEYSIRMRSLSDRVTKVYSSGFHLRRKVDEFRTKFSLINQSSRLTSSVAVQLFRFEDIQPPH
ncbi:unnamed protein product, partial [Nesidiocoris tenuis]